MTLEILTKWLMAWRRKTQGAYPLGTSEQEISALKVLRSTPQWQRYLRVLERVGEQQASEVASGLAHDRYLFACGALNAIRRVYTLVDDVLATAAQTQEIANARQRTDADRAARTASTFLNTPWYDSWRRSG